MNDVCAAAAGAVEGGPADAPSPRGDRPILRFLPRYNATTDCVRSSAPNHFAAGHASMSTSTLVGRITSFLVAWRLPLLALALMLFAFAWGPSQRLRFDRSLENMFAPDNPILVPYRQLKRTFGGNEVVIVAYVDPQLLAPSADGSARPPGLARLDELTTALSKVKGVASVASLSNAPLGDRLVEDNALSRAMLRMFEGFTVGADHQTAAVVCILERQSPTSIPWAKTLDAMREVTARLAPRAVLAGEPVMIVEGFRSIDRDGRLLGWVSTVLLTATILLCFRSLRWVVVPLLVVNVTLVWTQALLVVGGFNLTMVSSMLWAVITVVGIATVMHLIVGFREERGHGVAPTEALSRAGSRLAVPIIWALATDVAGFGSLLSAGVGPVQDFGFMMALGSGLALFAVAFVLPGTALLGRFDADPRRAWGEDRLDRGLRSVLDLVLARTQTVALLTLVGVAVISAGAARLEVESDFTRNFRASSPVVQSYSLVESRLGGAGVWDVFVPAPDKLDAPFMDRVRRLQERLRTEVVVPSEDGGTRAGLTKVISLVDALDATAELEQSPLMALLGRTIPVHTRVRLLDNLMPGIVPMLLGTDPAAPGGKYYRIMLRAREQQPASQKKRIIEEVTRVSREEFSEAQVTGFFVLLTHLIDSLVHDQWLTFGIAAAAIGLMMLVAFRSVRLAIIALLPNLLPMFLATGVMGWLGLRMNMGAAMIAAVSVGLSVDSSVHYLTDYLRARRQGKSLCDALHDAHQGAGRAMTFATLALMIGFSALCFSQFLPIVYFGALMCLAMLGGLAGNLVVLPLLLRLTTRESSLAGESSV
jgi:uncharacterized protein